MPFTKTNKLIPISAVRDILPVSDETIRQLLQKGKIRGAIYGNKWMTTEEWVCEYIEEESRLRRHINGSKVAKSCT